MDQEKILNHYYHNNASRLKEVVNGVVYRLGIKDCDLDEYYSLADEVFFNALRSYNEEKSNFDTHINSCLVKRFKDELKRRNRGRRKHEVVLDENFCISSLPSIDDVETEVMIRYGAEHLEDEERIIFFMRMDGYTDSDIRKHTGMCNRRFYKRLNSLQKKML